MYEDLLKEYFSNVTIECDERLIPLFKNSFKKNMKFYKTWIYSSKLEKIK